MKNFIYIFIYLTCFFVNNASSQTDALWRPDDFLINPTWEFYSENLLSAVSAGRGNTGIADFGDLSSLILNPASVNTVKKYQFYAGATYKTDIEFPYSYNQKMRNVLPSCIIGGIYKINNNLQVGFVYRNDYVFQGEYGAYYFYDANIKYTLNTHNFTVPVVYNYKWITAGVNINLTNYRGDYEGNYSTMYYPEGYYSKSYAQIWRFVPQFGVIAKPTKDLSFGVTYTPGFVDSTEWKSDMITISGPKSPVKYPWRLGIGSVLRLFEGRMKVLLDYHFEKTSVLQNHYDKSNFNFGVEYNVLNNLIIRSGFFTLKDFKDYTHTILIGEKLEYGQNFLTIGTSYFYKDFSFNIAVMDSHLASTSSVSHTRITGGVRLDF